MKPTCSPEALQLFFDGQIALTKVEAAGMRIDVPYLERAIQDADNEIKSLTADLEKGKVWRLWRKEFGDKAKLDSPVQLATILFDRLGYQAGRETSSSEEGRRRYSTDEESLSRIDDPFVKDFLRIKGLKKFRSTYLDGIKREIVGDRIHPSFNLNTVTSYRSSSNLPNVQNQINRDPEHAEKLRRCFIPSPGNWLVEIDYSAVEVRVSACYNRDPNLIEYINDPTKDMHRDMAMQIYRIKRWEDVPEGARKAVRYAAKNQFVFPQFYGSVWFQCAPPLWEASGKQEGPGGVPMREHLKAQSIRSLGNCEPRGELERNTFAHHVREVEQDFWGRRFGAYARWKKGWHEAYLRDGGFSTLTGFRHDGFFSRNEVLNLPVQGSAFHCLLWSLIQLQRWLDRHKMRCRIINEVHDSLLLDCPKDELQDVLHAAVDIMTRRLRKAWDWIIVPLEVEVECSRENWWAKRQWTEQGGTWKEKVK